MKAYELRELTFPELVDKLDENKEDLFNLRFQIAVSQADNTARLGELRRDIARIKTVMGEWSMDENGEMFHPDFGVERDRPPSRRSRTDDLASSEEDLAEEDSADEDPVEEEEEQEAVDLVEDTQPDADEQDPAPSKRGKK